MSQKRRVLQQIRVLDLSPYLPSQYCSFQLAQLGAEVILVERPGQRPDAFPGLFELINCNKKSIQLDLRSDLGREIFHRLARISDVILEGSRPGVASRLKIGYEDIKGIKPDIIYCSISGFGQDGPYRDKPGHDVNYLALSGYFAIPGQIGTVPSRPGIPVVDLCAGMLAAFSILTGLMARERTGDGQYIDIAMFDAIIAWTGIRAGRYMVKKQPITDEHVIATNDVFQTRDNKLIALGIVNEEHFWQNFCNTTGNKMLLEDMRFSTQKGRLQNKEELSRILRGIFSGKTREEWLQLFENTDVPLTPVSTLEEALSDPQLSHRGLIKNITDPESGEIDVIGLPVKFSGVPTEIQSPPPRAGQHTREILEQLGYNEEVISSLEPKEGR
jgi:crotonobetainyl-CoA:carnitine CoA-transferase CaiB-like acyl-CoA transferase